MTKTEASWTKTCRSSTAKVEMAECSSNISTEINSSVSNGDCEASEEKDVVASIPRKSSVLKRDSGKRSLQKSVSFSSRPEEKKVINGGCICRAILPQRQNAAISFVAATLGCSSLSFSRRLSFFHAKWMRAYESSLELATVPTVLHHRRRPVDVAMEAFIEKAREGEK